ncbi:septation protein SepH [Arthrobacter woluwensis]|jgi:hypothetical protein|uniref:septation protein SepH n=1 Tax=Arthrobacter woluwensis TaxID=156980 RepID=UPI00381591F4
MQELRLLGVHDDGDRLLLSDSSGERYELPLDEALRRAIARAAARPSARSGSAPSLSPRDIQARIRAGATAAEVAEESGLPLASVERYEGPVLAERAHVADQARGVEVPGHLDDGEGYRSAFGQDRAFLGEMVEHRLKQLGVPVDGLSWDSKKVAHGLWEVTADFDIPESLGGQLGEEPPARWTYSPLTKTLQNANRWAQHLSELEPLPLHVDSPWGSRRLSAVRDHPFDVEADAVEQPASDDLLSDSESLVDLLNSRRGQRLGVDEDSDDTLALLLSQGIPAAHPRPSEVDEEEDDTPAAEAPRLRLALPEEDEHEDDGISLSDGVSTHTREIRVVPPAERGGRKGGPSLADEIFANATEEEAEAGERAPLRQRSVLRGASFHKDPEDFARAEAERRQREEDARRDDESPKGARSARDDADSDSKTPEKPAKRRSVPSWDEIVFGTKGDN